MIPDSSIYRDRWQEIIWRGVFSAGLNKKWTMDDNKKLKQYFSKYGNKTDNEVSLTISDVQFSFFVLSAGAIMFTGFIFLWMYF